MDWGRRRGHRRAGKRRGAQNILPDVGKYLWPATKRKPPLRVCCLKNARLPTLLLVLATGGCRLLFPPLDSEFTGERAFWQGRSVDRETVVIAAAGDISLPEIGGQKLTSDLIVDGGYDAVLLMGDTQYPRGELANFKAFYDPTWGRFLDRTHPSPGNHEYSRNRAADYYAYFGERAGEPTRGYYSFDLGAWHFVSLNSNCGYVNCSAESVQVRWLKADLASNKTKCVLAFWHTPRFNSGDTHGDDTDTSAFWDVLYEAGVDVVLNGHEHIYERFQPQDPLARADDKKGIRAFTVGTGGATLYKLSEPRPNSAVRHNASLGVLKMTLSQDAYAWEFMAVPPSTFNDVGSARCH